jgi:hypothetical protein
MMLPLVACLVPVRAPGVVAPGEPEPQMPQRPVFEVALGELVPVRDQLVARQAALAPETPEPSTAAA